MVKITLEADNQQLLTFDAQFNNQSHRPKSTPEVIICRQRYADEGFIERMFADETIRRVTALFSIPDPVQKESLSKFIASTVGSPCVRFFYVDKEKNEQYLFHFSDQVKEGSNYWSSSEASMKIEKEFRGSVALIRIPLIENHESDISSLDANIELLQKKYEEVDAICVRETERANLQKLELDKLKREEIELGARTDSLKTELALAKEKNLSLQKSSENMKELKLEKERLTKQLADITKDHGKKKKEMLDNLEKKYEKIRNDVLQEGRDKLIQYQESENRLRVALNNALTKKKNLEAQLDDLRKSNKDKQEELARLTSVVQEKERKKSSINQLLNEKGSDMIEIGNCRLCKKKLANIVNFPCHHFAEVCDICVKKPALENKCIKCWKEVEQYEVIRFQ